MLLSTRGPALELELLAFEVVSMVVAVAALVAGAPPRVTPVELVSLLAVFVLLRCWYELRGDCLAAHGCEFRAGLFGERTASADFEQVYGEPVSRNGQQVFI